MIWGNMSTDEHETSRVTPEDATVDPLERIVTLGHRAAELERLQARTRELGGSVYEMLLVSDLHKAVESVIGVEDLLDVILERCTSLVGAHEGSIFVYDSNSDELVLRAVTGRFSKALEGLRQQLGDGVAGYVAQRREPVVASDIDGDGRFTSRESERYDSGSFASVPIVDDEKLLGVINVSGKDESGTFDEDDLRDLLIAANYSADAIAHMDGDGPVGGFTDELHGRLDGAIGIVRGANRELLRLREAEETIINSIPLGLVAFDENYARFIANPKARELLGLDDKADMKQAMFDVDISQTGHDWRTELAELLSCGRAIRLDSATLTSSTGDAPRTVRVIGSAVRSEDGHIGGGVVVLEDITEEVRMEHELAASERHAAIGRLAAGVAHELNNPLDGILRFINLALKSGPESDKAVQYLDDCKLGVQRMAGIVSSLLEFSRAKSTSQRNVGINQTIQEAAELMRPRAQDEGIEIVCELLPNQPQLRCGEMVQVFMNLFKNAFDAMPGGGKMVVRSHKAYGKIIVEVTDMGEGIPEANLQRIFEPFFTTKPPSKGTGLGLAVCHDIVGKYSGTISVRSDPGGGTTFTIAIPVP